MWLRKYLQNTSVDDSCHSERGIFNPPIRRVWNEPALFLFNPLVEVETIHSERSRSENPTNDERLPQQTIGGALANNSIS